ncbi:MAG: hypothetical protein MZV49_23390 [Rhodopseudomonas palustris]|nr:hypothetical protein [Rhodopseudomonas palustris]
MQFPHGHRRDRPGRQPRQASSRGELKLSGDAAGRHLSRQDHQVERPGASTKLNPEREAAGRGDHRRAPLRRFGHHLQLRPTTCPR